MENITNYFKDVYVPYKGIVVFKNRADFNDKFYVESFDFTPDGRPLALHPLSHQESLDLSESLQPDSHVSGFLHHRDVLPYQVLHIDSGRDGKALWYTTARLQSLLFQESLQIPSGPAHIPALLWYANKRSLRVFALGSDERPQLTTKLFHAPFFNVYEDGEVCMGDVNIQIKDDYSLLDFISKWERYFFRSYFSHLIMQRSPVKGNIVQLWCKQVNSDQPFPTKKLLPHSINIKNLIHAKSDD